MAAPASEKQFNWSAKVSFGDEIKEFSNVWRVDVDRAGTLILHGRTRGGGDRIEKMGITYTGATDWVFGFAAGKWDTYKIE